MKTGGDNGGGRPRKLPELDKLLADVLGEEKDGVTAAEAILKKLRQIATAGSGSANLRAAEILLDRGYGKAKQVIDANINDQREVTITRKVIRERD